MPLKKDVFFVFTSFSPCTSWIFTKGSENWTQSHRILEIMKPNPSTHSSIQLSINPSFTHPTIHSSIFLSDSTTILFLYTLPFTFLFFHQSIHLSIHQFKHPLLLSFIHFSVHPLSISPFLPIQLLISSSFFLFFQASKIY